MLETSSTGMSNKKRDDIMRKNALKSGLSERDVRTGFEKNEFEIIF